MCAFRDIKGTGSGPSQSNRLRNGVEVSQHWVGMGGGRNWGEGWRDGDGMVSKTPSISGDRQGASRCGSWSNFDGREVELNTFEQSKEEYRRESN